MYRFWMTSPSSHFYRLIFLPVLTNDRLVLYSMLWAGMTKPVESKGFQLETCAVFECRRKQTNRFLYFHIRCRTDLQKYCFTQVFLRTAWHRSCATKAPAVRRSHRAALNFGSSFCRHISDTISTVKMGTKSYWGYLCLSLRFFILFFFQTTKTTVIPLWKMFAVWKVEHKEDESNFRPSSDQNNKTWKSTLKLQTWS